MRGQNAEGLRSRCVCCVHAIGLMLGGILLATTSANAGSLCTVMPWDGLCVQAKGVARASAISPSNSTSSR